MPVMNALVRPIILLHIISLVDLHILLLLSYSFPNHFYNFIAFLLVLDSSMSIVFSLHFSIQEKAI